MSEGLKKVGKELQAFSDKVDQCRDQNNSDMADIHDCYSRLYRAQERYRYEAPTLERAERAPLRKVFEDDKFIQGMFYVRLIGDHVEKGNAVLRHTDNSPFTITSASSAAAVFSARCVRLLDVHGFAHSWDHVKNLTEAESRITRAFEKIKKS
jgi:hypothetical protein